jgi:cytochrome c biogenesis protein CcmG, thiol:disulfide interchange protein DsbE
VTLRRSLVLLGLGLAVLAASVLGYRTGRRVADPQVRGAGPAAAAARPGPSDWLQIPAPDVAFRTLDGGEARLAELRGRVVLVNFWGTWCPPCLVEIPDLIRAQARLEPMGATIVGPAIDSGTPQEIRAFVEEMGINYPIWIGRDVEAVSRFGAPGYPFTLLIDREGVIRRSYIGPQTEANLLGDVATLLAGS